MTILIPILVGLLAQIALAWLLSDHRQSFAGLAASFVLADVFAAGFALAAYLLLAAFGVWH